MLQSVLASPWLKKVIVTQDITRLYLQNKHMCKPAQIEDIFGVVIPQDTLCIPFTPKREPSDSLMKVCFAAMRYTENGADKGYDVFLDVAKLLVARHQNIEFHVIGMFDAETIPLDTELKAKLTFHGVMASADFHRVLQEMDIILSANKDNVIAKGAFDGFPTASCVEAGLNGVLIMCTDPLKQNNGRFKNQEEIEIVEHDAQAIADRIEFYYHNRTKMADVTRSQYDRIQQLYATEVQVGKRLALVRNEICLAKYAEKNLKKEAQTDAEES